MLGIIGAMDTEVAKLKEMMTEVKITKAASMEFYEGKLGGAAAVVVRAGVGKVNAACCTQALIDHFPVSCVINTGIAGSLQAKIDIGDIVLATESVEHDMDVAALGYAPGVIPDMEEYCFKADEKLRRTAIAHTAWLNQIPFLIVRAISDKADDSAQMDYPTFEAKAIEHSVRLIVEMARRLA